MDKAHAEVRSKKKDVEMAYVNTDSNTLGGFSFAGIINAISRGFKRMQVAQMQSALRAMTDAQLNQINVDRKDIAAHAEMLVMGETKV